MTTRSARSSSSRGRPPRPRGQPGDEPGPDRGQAAGQAPGGTATVDGGDVDAEVVPVHLHQALEAARAAARPAPATPPSGDRTPRRRRRSACARRRPPPARRPGAGRAGSSARTAPEPAVGRGRAPDADDDAAWRPASTRGDDQLAGARRGGRDRVVALGPPARRRPDAAAISTTARSRSQAPRRLDGVAERAGDDGRAVRARRARRGCPRRRPPSAPRRPSQPCRDGGRGDRGRRPRARWPSHGTCRARPPRAPAIRLPVASRRREHPG